MMPQPSAAQPNQDLASKSVDWMNADGMENVIAAQQPFMMSQPPAAQPNQKNKKKRKATEISATPGEMPGWDAHASGVKGRTDADRIAAKKIYAQYAQQRLYEGADVAGVNVNSDDW